MKANVGSYDCAARFVLGCLVVGLAGHGLGGWAALGVIPILTSIVRFCPLYSILHVNTEAWEERFERRHGR
jgi:hypothetical protein